MNTTVDYPRQKPSDPDPNSKTSWYILERFYNGKKITKYSTPTDQ